MANADVAPESWTTCGGFDHASPIHLEKLLHSSIFGCADDWKRTKVPGVLPVHCIGGGYQPPAFYDVQVQGSCRVGWYSRYILNEWHELKLV